MERSWFGVARSRGVASGLLTLKSWCRLLPNLKLVLAGVCASVAGSDLGVEIFEAVTSPGTMQEGQPGNRLKIPTVSPSCDTLLYHPLPAVSLSWNFGDRKIQQYHSPGNLETENSSSITLLEFWGPKNPAVSLSWNFGD